VAAVFAYIIADCFISIYGVIKGKLEASTSLIIVQ